MSDQIGLCSSLVKSNKLNQIRIEHTNRRIASRDMKRSEARSEENRRETGGSEGERRRKKSTLTLMSG